MERLGVANAADLEIDTLADRRRRDTLARGAVLHLPELIAPGRECR